jgi:hypothetical protein
MNTPSIQENGFAVIYEAPPPPPPKVKHVVVALTPNELSLLTTLMVITDSDVSLQFGMSREYNYSLYRKMREALLAIGERPRNYREIDWSGLLANIEGLKPF